MAKVEQLLIQMPTPMKERLKEVAEKLGVSMSYIAKVAIDEYLARKGKEWEGDGKRRWNKKIDARVCLCIIGVCKRYT